MFRRFWGWCPFSSVHQTGLISTDSLVLGALKPTAGGCRHNRALRLGLMNRPVLATSDLSAEDQARIEDEDARCDWEQSRDIVKNGPFAPGDTAFAMGHYSEDRLVEFDYLVVTLGDIMRECAIPDDQRGKQRLISRSAAEYFLRFYDGPERTLPLLQN